MHTAGAALCAALDAHAVAIPAPEHLGEDGVRARLFVDAGPDATPIAQYDVPALQAFVANLQAEFASLYSLDDDGYSCHVDLTLMLLAVMRRLGHWLRHDFLPPPGDVSLRDVAAPGAGGWHTLRPDVARHMLDAVHAMLSAHRMLVSAAYVPAGAAGAGAQDAGLHPVHREASMDAWWELATVADCPIGGITQYKNKFQFLFHSVSQVVYYHYPSYTRRSQRAFADITGADPACPPLHKLPLLLQLAPDVPLLYEHTGAGFRPAAARQPHAWCVVGSFVLLVDRHADTFCAHDYQTLLAKTTA